MDLDPKDRIILAQAPLVAMPRFTNFPPLEQTGHRFIVAEDGLYLELDRPWLHVTRMVAESPMPLPYGPVIDEGLQFGFEDDELTTLIARFIVDAKAALPAECAAWGVWNEQTERLEYRPCLTIQASAGGVEFHRPRLAEHEHLAVDIHSHGQLGAFFSGTDDEDDAGAVKLAVVVGELHTDEPSIRMRLCALSLFLEFEGAAE